MSKQRIETIGDATLYLGDCREIMSMLGKVDAVVTDPPYDDFTHDSARCGGKAEFGVGFVSLGNVEFVSSLLAQTNHWLLFFCALEMLGKYQAQAGDKYVRGAVWDRIVNSPQLSGDRPAQGAEGIAIFHAVRKNMKWNGNGRAAIWRHSVERGSKEHPTQKPLALIEELASLFSDKGQTIFDPFMGSGTTGVACANLGRKFIGIEIEPKYFDIACKRIDHAYRYPQKYKPMFEKGPKPKYVKMFEKVKCK